MNHQLSFENLAKYPSNQTQEHVVQFCTEEPFLISSVARFIISGIQNEEGILVIAVANHRHELECKLRVLGVDIEFVKRRGQLNILDAHELLAQFMVRGLPDKLLFNDLFSSLIEKMGSSYGSIRAYGEMVNVLWSHGNAEGALALENLWNEFAENRPFSLLCGYMVDTMEEDTDPDFQNLFETSPKASSRTKLTLVANDEERIQRVLNLQEKILNLQTETRVMMGFAESMLNPEQKGDDKVKCAELIMRNGEKVIQILEEMLDSSGVD